MKGAPIGETVFDHAAPAKRHHRRGRFDGGEVPARKMRREHEQLRPRARADAENARPPGQSGEDGAHLQMQRIANRDDFGEALIVSRRMRFIETDQSLGVCHARNEIAPAAYTSGKKSG